MTGTDERVAIRRKSDDKFYRKGNAELPFWWSQPTAIGSRAKAETMIKVDWGRDLADYEILPWAEVPDEAKS